MDHRPRRLSQTRRRPSAQGRASQQSASSDYANLDELAGPAPIQNPGEESWYEHRSLHEGRADEKDDEKDDHGIYNDGRESAPQRPYPRPLRANRPSSAIPSSAVGRESWLAEVGAPEPVQNPDQSNRRRSTDLEDVHDESRRQDIESSPSDSSSPNVKSRFSSQTQQRVSRFATELYTVSYLILFSILGTLARLGVEALTFYPGTPLAISSVWVNFGGSLVMGFLSEDRRLFRDEWGEPSRKKRRQQDREHETRLEKQQTASEEWRKAHAATKKTIPLYIGLATGFCGSFTSFSTFMRDVFLALSNDLPTTLPATHFTTPTAPDVVPHRNPGYSVMAILAVLLVTISLSIVALQLGAVFAIALHPFTPTIPFSLSRKMLDRLGVVLGWGCWFGAIIMAIFPPDRPDGPVTNGSRPWSAEIWRSRVLFSLVFAPLGCLGRFYASLHLNGVFRSFPLGTFAVNAFGTAVLGMSFDLQRIPLGGRVGCGVLQGIQEGFCGCLTTVSTWVVELTTLRRRHAWTYGLVSVATGLSLLVAIIGSLKWSVGFSSTVC